MSEKTPDELWREFSALYESKPPNDPLEELARRAAGGDVEALRQLHSEASHYKSSSFHLRLKKASSDAKEDRRSKINRQNALSKKGKLAWHNQVLDAVLEYIGKSGASVDSVSKVVGQLAKLQDQEEEWDVLLDKLNSRNQALRVEDIKLADPDSEDVLTVRRQTGQEKTITREMLRHAIRRIRKKTVLSLPS